MTKIAIGDQSMYPHLWRDLIGLWSPDLGPTGLTLRDRCLKPNHGTLVNMVADTEWNTRFGHRTIKFDGTAKYINTALTLSGLNRVTVVLWGTPRLTTTRLELCQGTNSGTRSAFSFAEDGNAYIVPTLARYGSVPWSTYGTTYPMCGVFAYDGTASTDAGKIQIWINGIKGTVTFTGSTIASSIPSYSGTVDIGRRFPGDTATNSDGNLLCAAVYSRVLTENEVSVVNQSPEVWFKPRRSNRMKQAASAARRRYLTLLGVGN